ncbi:MAG: helix-turn-helix domain-containing protein [Geobacteraceae bacterium]
MHTEFKPEALRELRKQQGLTATAFLEKSHVYVTRATLSRWENGLDFPGLQSLIKIANAYQVRIEYFFSVVLSSNDNCEGTPL